MRESLRARLLLWHVATGAAIIAAFGASVSFLTWHTRLAAIDASLEGRAAQLEAPISRRRRSASKRGTHTRAAFRHRTE